MSEKINLSFKPKEACRRLLSVLTKRGQDVIVSRYGLGAKAQKLTLDAIGKKYNITRERVRQIENHSLATIRKSKAYKESEPVFTELKAMLLGLGGIVSGTYTWWKNVIYDFSTESITPSATTIQAAMNSMFLSTLRGRDQVDLIVADNTYYTYYWSSLQTNQRYTNPRLAEAGFDNLKFKSADVVVDGGKGGDAPASHMYFLNTNYLHWRPHAQRNMVPLNPDRHATNQDAVVKLIAWAGNMTASNRSLQGLILA